MPNKAIMLLCIMDLVRCGIIVSNRIEIDDMIQVAFEKTWKVYFSNTAPSCWTPFWHMKKESFWHFKPKHSQKEVDTLAKPGETASIGKIRRAIQYTYLDNELFDVIQTKEGRNALYNVLYMSYIKDNTV